MLAGIYDAFLARLVEAARAVKVGPADDPETLVGPVIDAEARGRVLEYQRIAAAEGRVVFQGGPGPTGRAGAISSARTIVADVAPMARVAQEEIFGPVLAVLKATDLDDALRIANGTPVRPDRRPLFAQPGEYRAGPARVPRRQPLHQPRDHRGAGRPPAVRRVQALGHRHQGRRARLSARIPAHALRHREHHAPRVRADEAQPDEQ